MVGANHLIVMPPMRWSKLPDVFAWRALLSRLCSPIFSAGPMELVAAADKDITVVVYDIGLQPALARFFENPEPARLAKYSIVLTNGSTKHIVGMAMRWVRTDQHGQTRTTTQSLDSFGTNVAAQQPVVPAGTQLIATPNGFQHVRVRPAGGFISASGSAGGISTFGFGRGQLVRIDDLDQAQRVTAMVDTNFRRRARSRSRSVSSGQVHQCGSVSVRL